jgi:hypothetical protein
MPIKKVLALPSPVVSVQPVAGVVPVIEFPAVLE